jgi:hypothetical protein
MAAFTKGDSRINRNGRPRKDQAITDLIRKELNHKGADGIPKKKTVVKKLIDLALSGDVPALKYLVDRVDGKPVETVDMSAEVNADMGITQMSREERTEYIKKLLDELGYVYRGTK